MAPYTLIVIGIALHFLNQQPGVHFGLRGVPWLDVPSAFVILGGLAIVAQYELRRRKAASTQPPPDEGGAGRA